MKIATITPAKNEIENLPKVFRGLALQTVRPDLWLIVDDGSTDGTYELAARLAGEHGWIRAVRARLPLLANMDRTFKAFQFGASRLTGEYDLLMKLDADTVLPRHYFEAMAKRFSEDKELGIASGVNAYERTTSRHPRGNNRVYRWECWNQLKMPESGIGWDTLDVVQAWWKGWRTRAFRELVCYHLRRRLGDPAYRLEQGKISRYLGYHPWYSLGRAVLILAYSGPVQALAFLIGYTIDAYGHLDPGLRRLVRNEQLARAIAIIRAIEMKVRGKLQRI